MAVAECMHTDEASSAVHCLAAEEGGSVQARWLRNRRGKGLYSVHMAGSVHGLSCSRRPRGLLLVVFGGLRRQTNYRLALTSLHGCFAANMRGGSPRLLGHKRVKDGSPPIVSSYWRCIYVDE